MKIGYACIPLKIPNRTNRSFSIKNYNETLLTEKINSNLDDLLKILKYNISNDIYLFRIASDIIPFGSHPINNFNWSYEFKDKLKIIGNFIKKNNIRVSMHPGQYTVINSNNSDTVKKSIKDLEYHTKFLDSFDLDNKHKIILHIGGIYNDKPTAINNFINTYNSLPLNIKNRLVIENDEKNYSIDDLIYISEKCSIPIVYDNLHNYCFKGFYENPCSILSKIKHSWKYTDGNIKVHYSEQDINKKQGSHSFTITSQKILDYILETQNFDIDIMLEVKDKDFSAIKAINLFKEYNKLTNILDIKNELTAYEFYLKEKDKFAYEKGEYLLNTYGFNKFYSFIESLYYKTSNEDTYILALKEIYFKLEPLLSNFEINHFNKLIQNKDFIKGKNYLYKLCQKKNLYNMISMYYFYV